MLLEIALSASLAHAAFGELREMCTRDGGEMWGVSLCGPTLLADPATRAIIASEPAPADHLPQSIGIGNTAVNWNGKSWTMIMLPLPEDAYARRVLLAHESFHRIAGELGFDVGTEGGNAHLDTLAGRYWMRLEWRALSAALRGDRRATEDALAFRAERRRLFAGAAAEEQDLEIREGLAEYIGTALAEPDIRRRVPHLLAALEAAETKPSFVRSFAYASGPAWGTLLEMRDRNWTRHLRAADDLGALIGPAPASLDAERRAQRYGGLALLATERRREAKREAMLREFRQRFVDGPRFVLPLKDMRFEFNPNTAVPFGSHGTVYRTLTVHDDWGTLVAKGIGGLISADWKRVIVPADPAAYELRLNPGWEVVAGETKGDETIRMKDE